MEGARVGGVTLVILVASWLAGGFLTATWVGTALDGRPAPLAAATATAVAALAVGIVPGVIAWRLHAALAARGWDVARRTVWSTVTAMAALLALIGAQTSGPGGVAALLRDRGTWLFDAVTGAGPYGTAAVPEVQARLAELAAPVAPDRAVELLCSDGAGVTARAIAAAARSASALPSPRGAALDAIVARADAGDGPGALRGALDLVAATVGEAPLSLALPDASTLATAERARLVFHPEGGAAADGSAVEARRERGAWRVCPPPAVAEEAGTRWVADVRAAALAALPPVPAPDPAEAEVRELVRRAFDGRAAWALGVPAAPGFASLFGPGAAVAEAERIRTWCRAWSVGDPGLAPAVAALDARWAATPERLPAEGGALLTEVEAACAPVAGARILVEAARGVPGSADDRRRWARLDGEAAATAAVLAREGGGFRVVVPTDPSGAGPVLAVVPDGAGWRIASLQ
jgi:hypothetical protein